VVSCATPEGAVVTYYSDLVSTPLALLDAIKKSPVSDPDSLEIIVGKELPAEYHGFANDCCFSRIGLLRGPKSHNGFV